MCTEDQEKQEAYEKDTEARVPRAGVMQDDAREVGRGQVLQDRGSWCGLSMYPEGHGRPLSVLSSRDGYLTKYHSGCSRMEWIWARVDGKAIHTLSHGQ